MSSDVITEPMIEHIARELCMTVGDDPDEVVLGEGTPRWHEQTKYAQEALEKSLFAPKLGVINESRHCLD